MASLQALVGAPGLGVTVKGFTNPLDGGQGDFYWDATCTDAAFPGMVIRPTGVSGAGGWRRRYTGMVHSAWTGLVINNPSMDQSTAILRLMKTYSHVPPGLVLDSGVYYGKNMIDSNSNYVHIVNQGVLKSHSTSAAGTVLLTFKNCKNITIDGLNFDGNYPVVPGSATGGVVLMVLNGDSNINILNCNYRSNGFGALALYNNYNAYIYNCSFDTTDWNIILFGGNNIVNIDHWTARGGTSESVVFQGLSGAVPLRDHDCHARNGHVTGKVAVGLARYVDLFSFTGNTAVKCSNGIYGTNVNGGGTSFGSPNSAWNPRDGIISNNIDSGSTSRAFSGTFTNVEIVNNHIFGSLGYGMKMGDTCYNVTVANNFIDGFSLARTSLAGEGITMVSCFGCYVHDNTVISDSANTCLHLNTCDSVWVENNKLFSTAQYQYDAQLSSKIFFRNNTGNPHMPLSNTLTFKSYNKFDRDTAAIATDTLHFKVMVYNQATGQQSWFANWSNLVGQNIIRPSAIFPNRLFASTSTDSLLIGYTSTGTPIGVFNVLGLSDFKGGIQGNWNDTILANKGYNRTVNALFNGGTTFNANSFTYNVAASSVGNNNPAGSVIILNNAQNVGSNVLTNYYSSFTKSGTSSDAHAHFTAQTIVNSGDTVNLENAINYLSPVINGYIRTISLYPMPLINSTNAGDYTGMTIANSTVHSGNIVNGISSNLDNSTGHALINHTGTAPTILGGNVNIGAGNSAGDASAILSAVSTTQGVLFPNMTATQKLAIATPHKGLMVFDTTVNQMSYYNGSTWVVF